MNRAKRKQIQIFAKAPHIGRVKTRLARDLGAHAAQQIYRELLSHSVSVASQTSIPTELWCSPHLKHPMFQLLACQFGLRLQQQRGRTLGQRMYVALKQGLRQHDAVVLIGSDCPGYSVAYLQQAFAALDRCPVVLGPAQDGGYVLIGVRRLHPALFQNIAWGTNRVMAQTRSRLRQLGWSWHELSPLSDVDDASDWARVGSTRES